MTDKQGISIAFDVFTTNLFTGKGKEELLVEILRLHMNERRHEL